MDPVEAVVRRGGGCRRSALLEAGISRHGLERGVRAGRLVAVGRGGIALPDAPKAVLAAVRLHARVGCLSAAELAGVPLLVRPEVPHLLCSRARPEQGIRWHRGEGVELQDLVGAVLESCRCRPRLEALAVVDAVLSRGQVELPDLLRRRQLHGRRVRIPPGAPRLPDRPSTRRLGDRPGFITLRFSYEDIVGDPAGCVDAVRAALARRRPGAFRTAI